MEPINQTAEEDNMIPGLCAFLLGICYEFNREPGEITRCAPLYSCHVEDRAEYVFSATIHPILTRLGVDMLSGRIIRLRDDDRFKAVGPDSSVAVSPNAHVPAPHHPHPPSSAPFSAGLPKPEAEEGEMWFDWAFVDFWKSNYCKIKLLL